MALALSWHTLGCNLVSVVFVSCWRWEPGQETLGRYLALTGKRKFSTVTIGSSDTGFALLCREAALEGCRAELAASQQQLTSTGQQLRALQGSFTKQTAELHVAQSRVAQLQDQVRSCSFMRAPSHQLPC